MDLFWELEGLGDTPQPINQQNTRDGEVVMEDGAARDGLASRSSQTPAWYGDSAERWGHR